MRSSGVQVLLVVILEQVLGQTTPPLEQRVSSSGRPNPCFGKANCHECIQIPTCLWCSKPNFDRPEGRCFQMDDPITVSIMDQCGTRFLIQPVNEQETLMDKGLSDGSMGQDSVQLRPQHVKLRLRPNVPYNLEIFYSQARNYPVDLYYVMDLSYSMLDDKKTLSKLGDLLAQTMENITSNFRLGFGSFVDKEVMPFVSTVPLKLKSPCRECAAPYGFKNHMSLSTNTSRFATEVMETAISGNLDAPEGGFDAIMQAIACRKEIGWRERARRLLVLSTDASFHYAGDGKLGGVVKPNDGECHMENNRYMHSTLQDYPSVSQINNKAKENSINLIFAVTEDQEGIYTDLKDRIEGSSVGVLSSNSSNVVNLVLDQYNAITSRVELKDTASGPVQVSYLSNCKEDGPPRTTQKCEGFKIGDIIKFTARIEVTRCPQSQRKWTQRFEISPVAVNESLVVEVEMLCDCPCERPDSPDYEAASASCNRFGSLQCGVCSCDSDHFGRLCECNSTSTGTERGLTDNCRPDNTTEVLCSGRGKCECGVCDCYRRANPDERVTGPFCECDNFSCDRVNGQVCGGEDMGRCQCGVCQCNEPWTGKGCECYNSTDTCVAPGQTQICSEKGVCQCGVCHCEETAEGRFSGSFCHLCPTCKEQCELLRSCVHCQQFEDNPSIECSKCPFTPIEVDIINDDNKKKQMCSYIDDDGCRYTFAYEEDKQDVIRVEVQSSKECPPNIVLPVVLGVTSAIFLIGLLFLLLWKILTHFHDKNEFVKFEKDRMKAKWESADNPIYKLPTSTFSNPMYSGQ